MKKLLSIVMVLLMVSVLLTACGCEHEWTEADCDTAKTCSKCGATEGSPLGHSWLAASCTTAKTCEICEEVSGEALGHSWVEVTCAQPKHCESCGETEGEALEHTWAEATTEAPKTCTECGQTEGERIITDERFTTEACAPLFGTWSRSGSESFEFSEADLGQLPEDGSLDWLKELTQIEGELLYTISMTFHNDGAVEITVAYDKESYVEVMRPVTKAVTYQTYAILGYSRDEIDDLLLDEMGMTMEEYLDFVMESITDDMLVATEQMCYYVDGGELYVGYDWDWGLEACAFALDADTLNLTGTDGTTFVFTKDAQ